MQQDKLEHKVKVALPGGELTIRWQAGQSVKMTGLQHLFLMDKWSYER